MPRCYKVLRTETDGYRRQERYTADPAGKVCPVQRVQKGRTRKGEGLPHLTDAPELRVRCHPPPSLSTSPCCRYRPILTTRVPSQQFGDLALFKLHACQSPRVQISFRVSTPLTEATAGSLDPNCFTRPISSIKYP
jgi:hypothetical protein